MSCHVDQAAAGFTAIPVVDTCSISSGHMQYQWWKYAIQVVDTHAIPVVDIYNISGDTCSIKCGNMQMGHMQYQA